MKIRVADFIAQFLVDHGITDCFSVVGGGAMYLNDAFGHCVGLTVTYNHHEQASAMAAEAYARVDNKIAAVCVTTGPGATNAVTGVVGGWMDSIPMIIFSGQARYETTVQASGLKLRSRGVQEFDIIDTVRTMTKYCELVADPNRILFCLEKAFYTAKSNRPGPCWLDIPLDVQGAMIETDGLQGFRPDEAYSSVADEVVTRIIQKISNSERPLLFVGNGVRLAGAHSDFLQLVEKLNVPVVTGMSSIDAISSNHPLFVGRNGTTGDRAGNFAVQNCDLLLSLGSRLSFFQTGFNFKTWAQNAYKIVNDIDFQELEKDSLKADLKVCCDVKDLISKLNQKIELPLKNNEDWVKQCQKWKSLYPVVQEKHFSDAHPNIYAFYKELTSRLSEHDVLVSGCGTSRVAGSQAAEIKEGMRFITNVSTASMGYDLPAAIGVCIARHREKTILVTGDGSVQMNLQELQTIVHNRLPIIIFIMNNQGYHSIRMTQNTYFKKPLIGVGPESGDLSFPDTQKIADAYGIQFRRCTQMADMSSSIDWALNCDAMCICEMMLSTEQITEPKVAAHALPNGQILSASLEDMAPFLPEHELAANMAISKVNKGTLHNIVITGATSMLGIATIQAALDSNVGKIFCIVRPQSSRLNVLPVDDRVTVIECDIKRYSELPNLIHTDCEVFYHFAWANTGSKRNDDYFRQVDNIAYTLQALGSAHQLKCKKFICSGSQAEYGILDLDRISPDSPTNPIQPYGIAKYSAGKLAMLEAERLGIDCLWVRVFSLYGYNDKPNTLVSTTLQHLMNGKDVQFTPARQIWDYLYSADAGKAFMLLGERARGHKIYCLGSGKARPLSEYIQIIAKRLNAEDRIHIGALPYAENQVMNLCADISELTKDTGWEPETSFEKGIEMTIKYIENGGGVLNRRALISRQISKEVKLYA